MLVQYGGIRYAAPALRRLSHWERAGVRATLTDRFKPVYDRGLRSLQTVRTALVEFTVCAEPCAFSP